MSVASPYPKAVPEANRYIGQRSKKLKGDQFLTGRAEYVNDLELLGTATDHDVDRLRRKIERMTGVYVPLEAAQAWRQVADVVAYVEGRMPR